MNIAIYDTVEKNRAAIYKHIKDIEPDATVKMFSKAEDLRIYADEENVNVAFINIDEAGGSGYFLAVEFRKNYPRMNLIMISEQMCNIQESMKLRASGYLDHIPTEEDVKAELSDLRYQELDMANA